MVRWSHIGEPEASSSEPVPRKASSEGLLGRGETEDLRTSEDRPQRRTFVAAPGAAQLVLLADGALVHVDRSFGDRLPGESVVEPASRVERQTPVEPRVRQQPKDR